MLKFTRETFLPETLDYVLSSILRLLRADTYDELKNIDNLIAANTADVEVLQEENLGVSGLFTGFTNSEAIVVTYNSTTHKVTLTGTFAGYYNMRLVTALVDGWVSPELTLYVTGYYLVYNGSAFVWVTAANLKETDLLIAYVYYTSTGTYMFCNRECHPNMPIPCHWQAHDTVGCYKDTGGDISNVVIASANATERRPYISETVISDDGLYTTLSALTTNSYAWGYINGTVWAETVANAEIVNLTGNRPYYNKFNGSTWEQATLSAANKYMCVWIIAFPMGADATSQARRFVFLQGQSEGTLAIQQALTPSALNLAGLKSIAKEICFIGKIILHYTGSNWVIDQVDQLVGTQISMVAVPADTGLQAHIEKTTAVHGSTSAATASTIVERDAAGRAQVASPSADADIATKKYVDDTNPRIGLFFHVQERQAQNVAGHAGATFTAGWTQRILNTVVTNTLSGASLSNSIITLPAGTYIGDITAPCYMVNNTTAKLVDYNSAAVILLGTTEQANASANDPATVRLKGVFTLSAAANLYITHYAQTQKTANGFGVACVSGTGVFTDAFFTKIS